MSFLAKKVVELDEDDFSSSEDEVVIEPEDLEEEEESGDILEDWEKRCNCRRYSRFFLEADTDKLHEEVEEAEKF